MKRLHAATSFAVFPIALLLAAATLLAQQGGNVSSTVTGGPVAPGGVRGVRVTGGDPIGFGVEGAVQGGSVSGGAVTGGALHGGGGSATGGTVSNGAIASETASATVEGRQVTARATGAVSISSNGPNANVTIGNHTVIVQKETLLVDGQERAKIPAGAANVTLQVANGHLSVKADGQFALLYRLDQPR